MTSWMRLYKMARANDPKHARAIARSRRNAPKTTNHGRQHRTAV